MEKKYPRIHLAIDNCIFYKRWTTPDEWCAIVKDLGINFIEASADTELDPLYMGEEYLNDWAEWVKSAQEKHGVKVANLYSGHGSYTTLGIAHPDARVRKNMVEKFVFPLIRTAAKLDCGLGFFAHAFPDWVLQSQETYAEYVEILTDELARVAEYAAQQGCGKVGVEKMYTPHQYPWRNGHIGELLRKVKAKSGCDFYFTEDVGHHHIKFMMPEEKQLSGTRSGDVWLGSAKAFDMFEQGADYADILVEMKKNPQLFSEKVDGDFYEALRLYGKYSPIVHLQQTNGTTSAHLPFTQEQNAKGIVHPIKLLRAIKDSYDAADDVGMPDRCSDIYLTLELFSGTTSIMRSVMHDCRQSVDYWREFIPRDGMTLDELLDG